MSVSIPPPHEPFVGTDNLTNDVWYRWLKENVGSSSSSVASHKIGTLVPFENLQILWSGVTGVQVTADALVLFNSDGDSSRFETLSSSLAITTSGANGLDTGAEASSTWYYIYGIGGSAGFDTILSTSSSAPTLPSGYTYYGLIGAVYNNGSSNFDRMLQRGRWVNRDAVTLLSAGAATSYTSLSLTAAVPALASQVLLELQAVSSAGTNVVSLVVSPSGSGTSENYGGRRRVSGNIDTNGVIADAQVGQYQNTIYYYVAGTNATANIYCTGWTWA